MLSPAQLLLVERLIAILTQLLRALDGACAEAGPGLRGTVATFALSHLVARLDRLRASAPAEPVRPRRAAPLVSNRSDSRLPPIPTPDRFSRARRQPPPRAIRHGSRDRKTHPAAEPTHA